MYFCFFSPDKYIHNVNFNVQHSEAQLESERKVVNMLRETVSQTKNKWQLYKAQDEKWKRIKLTIGQSS